MKTPIYIFKSVLILFMIFSILSSCKKDNQENEPEISQNETMIYDNVNYLDNQVWSDNFISMDSSTNTYIFNTGSNFPTLQQGDILVYSLRFKSFSTKMVVVQQNLNFNL